MFSGFANTRANVKRYTFLERHTKTAVTAAVQAALYTVKGEVCGTDFN